MRLISLYILLAYIGCRERQTTQNLQSALEAEKACGGQVPTRQDLFLEMNRAPQPSDESVEKEVLKLADDVYAIREEGSKNLRQMNDAVLKTLPFKNALLSFDPEVVLRATTIAEVKLRPYSPPTDAQISKILASTIARELANLVLRKNSITPEVIEFRKLIQNLLKEKRELFEGVELNGNLQEAFAIKIYQIFRERIGQADFQIIDTSIILKNPFAGKPRDLHFVKNNVIIRSRFALNPIDYFITTPADRHLSVDEFVLPNKNMKNVFRFNKAICNLSSIVLAQEGVQINQIYNSNPVKWELTNTFRILLVSSSGRILAGLNLNESRTLKSDGTSFFDKSAMTELFNTLNTTFNIILTAGKG